MKICRVVLTVVLLPVLLAMKALIFLCLFLTAVSSGLLSIVSSLLGMTALVSIFLIPIKSALILFVSAWLISPAGLPLAAQKLLEVLVPSSIMRKFIYKSGRTQSAQGRETCP